MYYKNSNLLPTIVVSDNKTPQDIPEVFCYLLIISGGSSQTRTGDTRLFRPLLYQLS